MFHWNYAKKFLWKVGYSELMCKSCARNFSDNIIVGVMLKSSDKFSKKRYAHKLYVVKSYAKRYHVRVWLKEVMHKSPMYYEKLF